MNSLEYDYLFKILLIGDKEVGKTSLILRFTDDTFNVGHPAIEDCKYRNIEVNGELIRLQLWDSYVGNVEEDFAVSFQMNACRGVHGIVIVYDVTNPASFDNIKMWLKEVNIYAYTNVNIIIVGTKADSPSRVITEILRTTFCNSIQIPSMEASAATGLGVETMFVYLALDIKRRMRKQEESHIAQFSAIAQRPAFQQSDYKPGYLEKLLSLIWPKKKDTERQAVEVAPGSVSLLPPISPSSSSSTTESTSQLPLSLPSPRPIPLVPVSSDSTVSPRGLLTSFVIGMGGVPVSNPSMASCKWVEMLDEVSSEFLSANLTDPAKFINWITAIQKTTTESLVNLQNQKGNTIIHVSCSNSDERLFNWLISWYGEEIDYLQGNKRGNTPLHIAALYGNYKTVNKLITNQPDAITKQNLEGFTPFELAEQLGYCEVQKSCLWLNKRTMATETTREEPHTSHNWQASPSDNSELSYLIFTGNANELRRILMSISTAQYFQACHMAICFGKKSILELLAVDERVAQFTANDPNNDSLVHLAATHGQLDVLKYMIETLKWSVQEKNKYLCTPLHLAAISNHYDVVKYLAEQDSSLISTNNADGNCPLALAAWHGHLDVAKYLISCNAPTERVNNDGNSALHIAAGRGHVLFVIKLLPKCNYKLPNIHGNYPIHLAAIAGHIDVVDKMLALDKDMISLVKGNGETFVHVAAAEGRTAFAHYYRRLPENLKQTKDGIDPLMLAVTGGHAQMVAALLVEGANASLFNKDGCTALHIAAELGNADIVSMLASDGRNCNIPSKMTGMTPLHFAVQFGHSEATKALVSRGALASAKDIGGQTVQAVALGNNRLDLLYLLDSELAQKLVAPELGRPVTEIAYGELQFVSNIFTSPNIQVYKATYQSRPVVVKKYLDMSLLSMFKTEVNTMSMLFHRNIISLIGASTEPPNLCIVMESAEKGDISSMQPSSLKLENKLQIARGIANGLAYLHAAFPSKPSILHNDIKTQNIFLTNDYIAKIGDFGSAELWRPHSAQEGTLEKNIKFTKGTVGFMAPEVMQHLWYSKEADVFSFGITLWTIFIEKAPFSEYHTTAEIIEKIMAGVRPPIPNSLPKKLVSLLEECWAHSPSQRPSMEKIINKLDAISSKEQKRGLQKLIPSRKEDAQPESPEISLDFSTVSIGRVLGQGGSGSRVHMCFVQSTICAVKIFDTLEVPDSYLQDMCKEIDLLQSLAKDAEKHNIVKYLHKDYENGHLRIFMQYLPLSLNQFLQKQKREGLPVKLLRKLALEVARGLNYLHARNPPIIHRDIKSANILLSIRHDGNIEAVRIADFGTAKITSVNAPKTTVGTMGFMAPEVVSAKSKIAYTPAADVFGFGMLLYELLTLETPSFAYQVPQLPKLPKDYDAFSKLFYQCINLQPKSRPTMAKIFSTLSDSK